MNTRDLTKIGICVAMLSVAAYISVPLPFTAVMLTALTLILNLIAFIMTPRQAFITVLVYILIGSVGVPVFIGGTAGFGRLFGPTGGFIWGFLIATPIISLCKGSTNSLRRYLFTSIFIGMPIIYLCGSISMCLVQKLDIASTLLIAVIPFIPGDIFKCFIAAVLGVKLNTIFTYRH